MSQYSFESITAAQALAFNPATDQLVLSSRDAALSSTQVQFGSGGAVTVTLAGRTVTFGAAFHGEIAVVDLGKAPIGSLTIGTDAGDVLGGLATFSGGGDDTLTSGGSGNLLDGGDGVDTVSYSSATFEGVTVSLQGGSGQSLANAALPDQLRNIENVRGSFFNDRLTGDGRDNLIAGGAGADTLIGLDGADTLMGEAGGDSLDGGAGDDVLYVGPSIDFVPRPDTVTGGAGSDLFRIVAGSGAVTQAASLVSHITDFGAEDRLMFEGGVAGTAANFATIKAASYTDAQSQATALFVTQHVEYVAADIAGSLTLFAPRLEAVVAVGASSVSPSQLLASGSVPGELYLGGAGNDLIVADQGSGFLIGLGGADKLVAGAAGNFTLEGGAGDDALVGGAGADSLDGGLGADLLQGGPGEDTLDGGSGVDTFVWLAGDAGTTGAETILDWFRGDQLVFGGGNVIGGSYLEGQAADFNAARALAAQAISSGAANFVAVAIATNFVAVATVADVVIFADGDNTNRITDVVILRGVGLDGIDAANFASTAGGPALPPPPLSGLSANVMVTGNMDLVRLDDLAAAPASSPTSAGVSYQGHLSQATLGGVAFAFAGAQIASGAGTSFAYGLDGLSGGQVRLQLAAIHYDAALFPGWVSANDGPSMLSAMLSGGDTVQGAAGSDLIRAFAGNDLIRGGGGADTVWGGAGDDVIMAQGGGAPAATYLRGEDGDDYILGGSGFDDINGNQGADTASGGAGDDWVVGGKDNDLLFGDAGADLVYGNLGADTCEGGDGADIVRGGQGNDLVIGDSGDDFISGDKGDDTMVGGTGADIFHSFGDAGIDRVVDFHAFEGDRVMLDPGSQYSVAQIGSDTVIQMTGGAQVILVGVQLSSLPPGWLFGA